MAVVVSSISEASEDESIEPDDRVHVLLDLSIDEALSLSFKTFCFVRVIREALRAFEDVGV